jgi:hypothetical protein
VEVDTLGRVLFGRSCRLRLALWILEQSDRRFYQSEPPPSVIVQSAAAIELQRLVSIGMLRVSPQKERRRVYYERTNSRLWSAIETIRDTLEE